MAARSDLKPRLVRWAVGILLACLLVAVCVWLAWPGPGQLSSGRAIGVAQPAQNDRSPERPERRRDRIVASRGLVEGRSGPIELHVELDKPPVPHLHHADADEWTNREQEEMLELASRLVRGEQRLAAMSLTSEQKAQLASINVNRRMVLSDADKQQLAALYAAWNAAAAGQAKSDAEQKFLAGMREIGMRSASATRASLTTGAQRVRQILTPEQFDRYRQITRGPRATQLSATRPSTRPATRPQAP